MGKDSFTDDDATVFNDGAGYHHRVGSLGACVEGLALYFLDFRGVWPMRIDYCLEAFFNVGICAVAFAWLHHDYGIFDIIIWVHQAKNSVEQVFDPDAVSADAARRSGVTGIESIDEHDLIAMAHSV